MSSPSTVARSRARRVALIAVLATLVAAVVILATLPGRASTTTLTPVPSAPGRSTPTPSATSQAPATTGTASPTIAAPSASAPPAPTTTTPRPTTPARTTAAPTTPSSAPSSAPGGPSTAADYLALIPDFPAAPSPVRVTMTHQPGRAAIFDRIQTSRNVAFITIDDGAHQLALTSELIRRSGLPMSIFLTTRYIPAAGNVNYFKNLRVNGVVIDNHTAIHPRMDTLTFEQQRDEICAAQDAIEAQFGRRPTNFRPPYLAYNQDTLRAAWECGITAVISGNVGISDGVIEWGHDDNRIHRGDIIILHFTPDFADDLIVVLNAVRAAGLTPALLTDYFTVAA